MVGSAELLRYTYVLCTVMRSSTRSGNRASRPARPTDWDSPGPPKGTNTDGTEYAAGTCTPKTGGIGGLGGGVTGRKPGRK